MAMIRMEMKDVNIDSFFLPYQASTVVAVGLSIAAAGFAGLFMVWE
jgi:hypothetical protein